METLLFKLGTYQKICWKSFPNPLQEKHSGSLGVLIIGGSSGNSFGLTGVEIRAWGILPMSSTLSVLKIIPIENTFG